MKNVAATPYRLGEPFRHDIRATAVNLAKYALLLTLIDPNFEEQLASSGLLRVVKQVTERTPSEQETSEQIQQSFKEIQRKTEGTPAPLKFLRRQLKHDAQDLFEKVRFLRYLDPAINKEIERFGLSEIFDHLDQTRST
jgi:hypothetical protein